MKEPLLTDLNPSAELQALLVQIANRFLTERQPTPRAECRYALASLGQGDLIDTLIRSKFLEYPDAQHVLPGLLTFDRTTQELRDCGQRGLDAVLVTLQRLFLEDFRTMRFSGDVLRSHLPDCDEPALRAGCWLAQHVGTFVAGVSWSPDWATIEAIGLREEILDYRSITDVWEYAVRQLIASTDLPADAPVFGFMADPALRAICERDYSALKQLQGPVLAKSRLLLAGGIAEAIILDRLLQAPRIGTKRALDELPLGELINVAFKEALLDDQAYKVAGIIKDYRNLVHPGVERRSSWLKVDDAEATIAESLVALLLRNTSDSSPGFAVPSGPLVITPHAGMAGVSIVAQLEILNDSDYPAAPVYAHLQYVDEDGSNTLSILGQWQQDGPLTGHDSGITFAPHERHTIILASCRADDEEPFVVLADVSRDHDYLLHNIQAYTFPRGDYTIRVLFTWTGGSAIWRGRLTYDSRNRTCGLVETTA